MMKKLFVLLVLISSITQAQHTIKGIMSPKAKTDWVILYKINGEKKSFVNNTTIKIDSIEVNGKKEETGTFEFKLPATAKPGSYRVNYSLEGATFVDIIYNKEDVSFIFNPNYPEESISFSTSKENKLYKKYLEDISIAQKQLDSIQIAVLQKKGLDLKDKYNKALNNVKSIQNKYNIASKNMYVAPFINANTRSNPDDILTTVPDYMSNLKNTFFDHINFTDKTLIKSSFLTDKILEYVFYINYTEDKIKQEKKYKESIITILSKIENEAYKKHIIEFLIKKFESYRNLKIIDYLFESHYYKLPKEIQNNKFIKEKIALLISEVGRIAPDFSWQENGKTLKLSTLNDAENYVLVFWSTSCSHCLREIPQLHTYFKDIKNVKVISFALEKDAFVWENYSKNKLVGWHNVLGLNKWQNKTARTYQIYSTPSYFILDKDKKIIAKPEEIKGVKQFFAN